MNVKWRGMTAVYAPSERELMRDLPVREQALVHTLKAFTQGEISSPVDGAVTERQLTESTHAASARPAEKPRETSGERGESQVHPHYTDPEDLEFGRPSSGAPKKTRPIYALVCTWKQSCRVPTKGEGEFWTKVWKLWYEKKGWKVQSHDTGYFASKDGERHSILLHEYEKDSHERLK